MISINYITATITADHEFASVSEVGDWIGGCKTPSSISAEYPNRTVQIVIGDPSAREATVNELTEVVQKAVYDRATAIRAFLARLAELE